MSGHSKWSTIKHKKALTDAKKSKSFSIVSKMISVAVREGGSGDVDKNPRLRLAIEKAHEVNMPRDNVQRAIDKGLGKGGGDRVEEIVYEGFGPGGVGFLIKALSDNRNRTAGDVKHILDKSGGSLGGPGSVMYMFEPINGGYQVKVPIPVNEETKGRVLDLIDELEEQEDVESVVHNMEIG
jgi:YebC/PmpR family DNA-binding regulatory protein